MAHSRFVGRHRWDAVLFQLFPGERHQYLRLLLGFFSCLPFFRVCVYIFMCVYMYVRGIETHVCTIRIFEITAVFGIALSYS